MKIKKELKCCENFEKITNDISKNDITIIITPLNYIIQRNSEISIRAIKKITVRKIVNVKRTIRLLINPNEKYKIIVKINPKQNTVNNFKIQIQHNKKEPEFEFIYNKDPVWVNITQLSFLNILPI